MFKKYFLESILEKFKYKYEKIESMMADLSWIVKKLMGFSDVIE